MACRKDSKFNNKINHMHKLIMMMFIDDKIKLKLPSQNHLGVNRL